VVHPSVVRLSVSLQNLSKSRSRFLFWRHYVVCVLSLCHCFVVCALRTEQWLLPVMSASFSTSTSPSPSSASSSLFLESLQLLELKMMKLENKITNLESVIDINEWYTPITLPSSPSSWSCASGSLGHRIRKGYRNIVLRCTGSFAPVNNIHLWLCWVPLILN
jgi:hypothetical protein